MIHYYDVYFFLTVGLLSVLMAFRGLLLPLEEKPSVVFGYT